MAAQLPARMCFASTNSDFARFECFRLRQMDRQQALFNAGTDARRVNARIEIENAAILASRPLAMHSLSEIGCRGAMPAENKLSILDGHFHTLLAYPGHFGLKSKPISVLMEVHHRREIFHALSACAFGWC
jgi:hypothetical protein